MKKKQTFEMKKIIKKNNGITLIALVITIIVLLILAGVTIATLTGENGILTRASEAAQRTEEANAREQVQLAVAASIGEDGKINYDNLNNELAKIDGLTYHGSSISDSNRIESLPEDVVLDGYTITINADGSINSNGGGITPPSTAGKTDGSYDENKKVNTPKLGSDMELVVYENGKWVTDETNAAYSYVAQTGTTEDGGTSEWANAKVTIDGVESYFVWIPRYAYKIDTINHVIDVKFIKGTGTEATDGTPCKYADDSSLNTSTDYIIHPAFTTNADLGGGWSTELPGIWIGKYESSLVNKSDSSYITTSSSDIGNILLSNNTDKAIAVQPNMSSWRYCTIGNMYTNALAYSPNLNSHMLKNSEWGAVAYLTHSQYGRNGTEIAINNSSNYITGTSGGTANASSSDATYAYNDTTNGVLASSTGNVYGIYDLSGGVGEYVAAYYGESSYLATGSSFANETSDRKYSTVYGDSGITGDATTETSGWNGDYALFVDSVSPFFKRGGDYVSGSSAGVFYFYSDNGNSGGYYSFRVSLAIQ